MAEVNLTEGYSLENRVIEKEFKGGEKVSIKYTFLLKGNTPVLMQPEQYVTPEKIQRVMDQTKGVIH